MQIKQTILDVLVSEGLTADDITELASRLQKTAQDMQLAVVGAEAQLAHNETVKAGIEGTIADATAKRDRALALISKITVQE